MKKTLLLFAFLFIGITTTQAQNNPSELALIQETINKYFDGWLTGNADLVGEAMHETCNLKFIKDGVLERRNKEEYLSGFTLRTRLENAEGRIVSVDITRTAAAAKVELDIPGRLFTDYFNLLKDNGAWYITDKVSTSIKK